MNKTLPNIHFKDYPIEFKEINPDDFRPFGFEVGEKVIIEPNEKGYIYDSLQKEINTSDKNTVVINVPVGYGKSYTIIKTINHIYSTEPKCKIIVAAPFISLVEQYVSEIKESGISSGDVFSYSELGRGKKESYKDKKVHVLTVNTLLGNPGEDGLSTKRFFC